MSRVDLLRASSIKAEAQYRQELSSVRSLRHEESRERKRAAESRKEFWRHATVAAQTHGATSSQQTPLSATERMWRAHETLKSALAKHNEALGRLQVGGERLASAHERIDVLQRMIGVAKRQHACRLENQRSDELGDLVNSLVRDRSRVRGESRPEGEPQQLAIQPHQYLGSNAVGLPDRLAEQSTSLSQAESKSIERVSFDSQISVMNISTQDREQHKALTVECSLGAKGSVSVSLVKRDGEAMKAVVSPESTQLALSTQRDRALVLSRLNALGVRVGSLSVGEDVSSGGGDRAGQRMKRRSRQEDDESRIA